MEHHNFWKDILAAAPYGIIVTDADWNVLLSNPVAQDWILSRENQHNILPQWLISAAKMQTSTVNHEDRVFTVTSAAMTLDGTLVHILIVPFLLLQALNPHDPSLHDLGALTSTLD